MSRGLAVLVLTLLALLVAPGVAGATHSNGSGPKNDFVNGSLRLQAFVPPFGDIDLHVHVNAKRTPSGDQTGHLFFDGNPPGFPPLSFHGRVTCVLVVGKTATVGGEVTNSKTPFPPEGSGFVFAFEDVGPPGSGDKFEGGPFPVAPPPGFCPLPFAQRSSTSGNVVVHDGS
jgi:hypothetical protein